MSPRGSPKRARSPSPPRNGSPRSMTPEKKSRMDQGMQALMSFLTPSKRGIEGHFRAPLPILCTRSELIGLWHWLGGRCSAFWPVLPPQLSLRDPRPDDPAPPSEMCSPQEEKPIVWGAPVPPV